jgi:hypothetical protein
LRFNIDERERKKERWKHVRNEGNNDEEGKHGGDAKKRTRNRDASRCNETVKHVTGIKTVIRFM